MHIYTNQSAADSSSFARDFVFLLDFECKRIKSVSLRIRKDFIQYYFSSLLPFLLSYYDKWIRICDQGKSEEGIKKEQGSGDEVNEHQALFNLANILSQRIRDGLFRNHITESQGKLLISFFNLFDQFCEEQLDESFFIAEAQPQEGIQTGLIEDQPLIEQPTMEEIDDDEDDQEELQSDQDEQQLDGASEMYYQSQQKLMQLQEDEDAIKGPSYESQEMWKIFRDYLMNSKKVRNEVNKEKRILGEALLQVGKYVETDDGRIVENTFETEFLIRKIIK